MAKRVLTVLFFIAVIVLLVIYGQLVPAIGPTEQIVAAVNEVADDNQRNGAKQGQPIVAADHLPHVDNPL